MHVGEVRGQLLACCDMSCGGCMHACSCINTPARPTPSPPEGPPAQCSPPCNHVPVVSPPVVPTDQDLLLLTFIGLGDVENRPLSMLPTHVYPLGPPPAPHPAFPACVNSLAPSSSLPPVLLFPLPSDGGPMVVGQQLPDPLLPPFKHPLPSFSASPPLRRLTNGGRPATTPSPTTMSVSFPAPPSPSPTASHTTKHAAGRRGCRPAPCKIMQGTDGVRSVGGGVGCGGLAGVSASPLQDGAGNRRGERGVPSAREGKVWGGAQREGG